jgi:hypothetical protein
MDTGEGDGGDAPTGIYYTKPHYTMGPIIRNVAQPLSYVASLNCAKHDQTLMYTALHHDSS